MEGEIRLPGDAAAGCVARTGSSITAISGTRNVPPGYRFVFARTLHSPDWWKDLRMRTEGIEIVDCREMVCCRQAWDTWLTGNHPMVAEDIKMMAAEGGNYFNFVQLITKVI
jgi:hypothetical protein